MRLSLASVPQLPIDAYVAGPGTCTAGTNVSDLNAVNNILYAWGYGASSNVSTVTIASSTSAGSSTTIVTRNGVPNYTTGNAPNTNIASANNPYNSLAQTFQIVTTGSSTTLKVTSLTLSNISIDTSKLTVAQFTSNLSALASLTTLSLNNITTTAAGGTTPYFTSIPVYSCIATAMKSLSVTNCGLTTWVPLNTNYTTLTTLIFSGNPFTTFAVTGIPTTLTALTVQNCTSLSMALPNFSTLTALTALNLRSSNLTGAILSSYFPSGISSILLSNNKLTGTLPSFSAFSLTNLSVDNNQISGTISTSLFPNSLTSLYLSNNQLTGSIPDFSTFGNLTILALSTNQFTGNIPQAYIPPGNLTTLSLSNNQLTGALPIFSAAKYTKLTNASIDICTNNFYTSLSSASAGIQTTPCWQDVPGVTKTSQDGNGVTFTISSYTVTNFASTGYIHIFKNGIWLAVKSTGTLYTDNYSNSNLPGVSDVYTFYLTPYNFSTIVDDTTAKAALIFSGLNPNVTNPATFTITPTIPALNVTWKWVATIMSGPASITSNIFTPNFTIKNIAPYDGTFTCYVNSVDKTLSFIINGVVTNYSTISINSGASITGYYIWIYTDYITPLSYTFSFNKSTSTPIPIVPIAATPVITCTSQASTENTLYIDSITEFNTAFIANNIAGTVNFYTSPDTTTTPIYSIPNFTYQQTGITFSSTTYTQQTLYVTFANSASSGIIPNPGFTVITPALVKRNCQSIPDPTWGSCPVLDQCGTVGNIMGGSTALTTTDLNGGYSCHQRVNDYNTANSTTLTYNDATKTVSYFKPCSAPACPGNFTVTPSSPSTSSFQITITPPASIPAIPVGDSYKVVLYNSDGTAVFAVTDTTPTGLASHGYNFTNAPQTVNTTLTAGTQYTLIAKLFELSASGVSFYTGKQASFSFTVPQNCVLPAVPVGGWSACNSSCGPGTQTQNVNIVTQQVGGGTACSAATVPVGVTAVLNEAATVVTYTQTCTSGDCGTICNIGTPAAGTWGPCSVVDQCGTSGTQTQAVTATSTVSSTTSSTTCSSLVTAYNNANSGKSATYDSGTNIVTYTQSCNSIPCPQSMTIVQSTTSLTTTNNAYVDITLTYSSPPTLPSGDTLIVQVTQGGMLIGVCNNITTNGTNIGVRITTSTIFNAGSTYTFTGTLYEKNASAELFNTGITAPFSLIIPQDCVLPATSLGTWSACSTDNNVCASSGTVGTKTMTLPITTPAVGTGTACSATTKPSGVSSMTFSGTDVTYTSACTSLVCPTVTITVTNSSTSSVTFTATTTSTFVNTYNIIITGWSGASNVSIPLTNPASSAVASFAWPAGQTYNNGTQTITATLKEIIGTGAAQTTPTSLTVPAFTIPSDCVIPSLNTSTNAWYCQDSTHTKKACGATNNFYQESSLTQASGTGQTCTNLKTTLAAPSPGITRGYITKNGSEYVTYTQTCLACPTVSVTVAYMGLNLKLISTLTIADTYSYYIVYSGFPTAGNKTTSLMSSSSTSNTYVVSDTNWHQGSTGTVTYKLYEVNSSTSNPATDFLVTNGSVAYTFPTDCQITPYDAASWSTCSATQCGTNGTVTQTKSITLQTTGGAVCDAVLATTNIPVGITASIGVSTITYTQACSAIACPGGLVLAVDSTYPVTTTSAHIDVDFGGSGFTIQFKDSNGTVLATSVLTPSTTTVVNVNTTSLNLVKGQTFTLTAYVYQTGFMSTSVATGTVQVQVPNDCVVTPVSSAQWNNCSTANPAMCGFCDASPTTCGSIGSEYQYQSYTPAETGGSCPALPLGATTVGNEIKYSRSCSTTGCVIAAPGIDSIVFTIPAVTGDTIYVSPTPFTKDAHGKVTDLSPYDSFVVGAAPGLSYTTATTTYTATGLTSGQAYTYNFQNSSATYPTSCTATTRTASIVLSQGSADNNNITVNVAASYLSDPVTGSTSSYSLTLVSGGATVDVMNRSPVDATGQMTYTFTSTGGFDGTYQVVAKLYNVNYLLGNSPIATNTLSLDISSAPVIVAAEPKQCNGICWLCWFYIIMFAYLIR